MAQRSLFNTDQKKVFHELHIEIQQRAEISFIDTYFLSTGPLADPI